MLDILANFDILGLGTLLGSLLFLGALLWVLIDNSSLEKVNERHRKDGAMFSPAQSGTEATERPDRPDHPRRAA